MFTIADYRNLFWQFFTAIFNIMGCSTSVSDNVICHSALRVHYHYYGIRHYYDISLNVSDNIRLLI